MPSPVSGAAFNFRQNLPKTLRGCNVHDPITTQPTLPQDRLVRRRIQSTRGFAGIQPLSGVTGTSTSTVWYGTICFAANSCGKFEIAEQSPPPSSTSVRPFLAPFFKSFGNEETGDSWTSWTLEHGESKFRVSVIQTRVSKPGGRYYNRLSSFLVL